MKNFLFKCLILSILMILISTYANAAIMDQEVASNYNKVERAKILELNYIKDEDKFEYTLLVYFENGVVEKIKETDSRTSVSKSYDESNNEKNVVYINDGFERIVVGELSKESSVKKRGDTKKSGREWVTGRMLSLPKKKEYLVGEEFELDGLPYENHLKKSVFTIYDNDINVYFVFNKHMDLLNKYYGFKKIDDDFYDLIYFELEDDQLLNSRITRLDKFPDNDDIHDN